MTFVQKLDIIMKKPIDKVVVEEIRKGRWKEKEDKWFKRRVDTLIDQMVQKVVDKCVKIWFGTIWISIVVREKGEKFH